MVIAVFDWDRDIDELVGTAAVSQADPAEASARGTFNSFKMLSVLFLVGIACAGQFALSFVRSSDPSHDLAAYGFVPFEQFSPRPTDIVLQMLDPIQADQFRASLRLIADGDLLTYSRRAYADLETAPAFMRPFHADAVALIRQDILRRGL